MSARTTPASREATPGRRPDRKPEATSFPARTASDISAPPGSRVATEKAVTALAARQLGVVTRGQLLSAGLGARAIVRRLERGLFRPVHRGVYLVGPLDHPNAREMAACLACGPTAVVSHRSAAALWRILPAPAPSEPVDIAVRATQRARPGIRVRRLESLCSADVTTVNGIPVTTPARVLLDLAGAATSREVERALAEAYARRLLTADEGRGLVARSGRRRGAGVLRALVGSAGPALTRSEAEELFLDLVRRGQIREPEANVRVAGYEVDFLWRAERLVVEVDGFAFHSSASAFERDRRKDAALTAAGMRVIRVTWKQISEEPEALLVRLARALMVG